MKRNPSNVGREWRAFRLHRFFTQAELANALAISRRQVQNIEYGISTPYLRTQARFKALKDRHDQEEQQ
ncbi:MAG TPA: helix-turn-helix transcriptional regulator [Edaphobacter sp.]|nr:helix-turn-helix transcriptional regulator [Edaphobacter sp.]